MGKVINYLECGCAILEDGSRSWCPTCLSSTKTKIIDGESQCFETLGRAFMIRGQNDAYVLQDIEFSKGPEGKTDALISGTKAKVPQNFEEVSKVWVLLRATDKTPWFLGVKDKKDADQYYVLGLDPNGWHLKPLSWMEAGKLHLDVRTAAIRLEDRLTRRFGPVPPQEGGI